MNECYSSVKYKSISLNCFTKIIKSAPKLNRSTCANKPSYPRIWAPSNERKVYKVSKYYKLLIVVYIFFDGKRQESWIQLQKKVILTPKQFKKHPFAG